MDLLNNRKPWTDEQLKLAFYLYCQLPFGKLHSKNPKIIKMAGFIGKTPNALAMKLVNIASLDPAVKNSGRKGLGNASIADKRIWDEFHNNWERLTAECELLLQDDNDISTDNNKDHAQNYSSETRDTIVSARIGQNFFRKAVLSSYQNICCMSGVSLPQLLIASHIIPWAASKENRLNPSNGLCLSAIHDRAFDKGFITVTPDYIIRVSEKLKEKANGSEQMQLLIDKDNKQIILPQKFLPNKDFLNWHNKNIFME
jgi:predicted restriction endonuclease